jgi:uncharacterized protein
LSPTGSALAVMTAPPASPCINICQMHEATGWCAGCLRTLDEIADWSRMNEAQKGVVWLRLAGRRDQWRKLQATGVAPSPAPNCPDAAP